ncbi:prolipoprotein diacylglyceryl transferase [Herbaspirillum huttiense]|jgi:prolipoprotein diacylglyceryl transferase|uniref:Phosphatidylglycerol--prolipoprotein diacylglyceryl transferase n=1 Tax=Herbaspirillum huttiense subsp. lycopersici TaxID=3074428 RepID=A0ABU2ENT9_9BURK|nr:MULTISPECIES: prolipoprotein diacylglyceryl transferase [Herbaspirillum]MAF04454.1 prolipoprotein diacylglyceryl transferase [Herbaspirillum sp.]MBN9357215.1 prolipoprotein diacylglyceryl transferase [Herbaspirillum huttiense]MBO14762.1 prolipoprotein diacylglyceryl transferase [Herbaspirillum sp.]MBP1315405.1 phosphatidylglycerol:prolipoprotein diacylglycerol transferase [Herbaspirillum sp. 1130]MCO4859090.1 prolipoprotein diacylglyceryl transferase [Herbaspirillum sp. WGmk3]|tara:strand:+ start:4654 stop:5490 length:837 start_codon:yes stop_codon:yes gene_type:complete
MLVHPMPDPIAIHIGPLAVHWYGLMYLLAFAQFIALGRLRIKQPHIAAVGWKKEDLDDMLFYGVLGVVLGGRLGEILFYNPAYYFAHPADMIAVWKGGMSFHGGFLGVMLAMYLWGRKRGRNLMDIMDFIAPMVPLGYAAGRLGNFINAELPGRPADPSLPWAMIWPNVDNIPRHPSPIYQMLVDGILLFIILWIFARHSRPRMAVAGMFSLLYGCARFFTEYFRVPDYEVHFGGITISAGQMLSVPMIVLGIILLVLAYRLRQQAQAPVEPAVVAKN